MAIGACNRCGCAMGECECREDAVAPPKKLMSLGRHAFERFHEVTVPGIGFEMLDREWETMSAKDREGWEEAARGVVRVILRIASGDMAIEDFRP